MKCRCRATQHYAVYDYTELRVRLRVPAGIGGFSFNHRFLTYEFPEYVCASYPDQFMVLLERAGTTANVASTKIAISATTTGSTITPALAAPERSQSTTMVSLAAKRPSRIALASGFSISPAIYSKLPYDPHKSFSPVMMLGASPLSLVVANKFPATSVRELIERARKQPGAINYASAGTGSVFHLTMEWFKQENNVNLVHVPYKGTAGVTADIISGQVQASLMVFQTIAPHVQAGRVHMLAVLGAERMPQFPQVPTLAESGMPGMVVEAWTGVMAPAKTPQSAINKLNAEINGLATLPENRETLSKLGIRIIGGRPEALDKQVRSEIQRWTEVVKRGNIKAQ